MSMSERSRYDAIDFDVDYYGLLGIDRAAFPRGRDVNSRREACRILQDAYRHRLFEVHPDRGGDPAVFKALVRAHSVLSDPSQREVYDRGKPPEGFEGVDMSIDWTKVGKYQRGSLADQVGTTLFLAIVEESGIEGLTPKFAPSDPEFHNYHWEFDVVGAPKEFVLSIIEDEEEVLRLTDGDQVAEASVPFKIYVCLPSMRMTVSRDEDDVVIDPDSGEAFFPGRILGIGYVDADLLSTTDYEHAMQFIRCGGLREAVLRCVCGGGEDLLCDHGELRDEMVIMPLNSGRRVQQDDLQRELDERGVSF